MATFDEIAAFMNSLPSAGQPAGFGKARSLVELHRQHRWVSPAGSVSFRAICERHEHARAARVRCLWMNTFLMNTAAETKPAVKARSRELGPLLASQYDLISLAEVWDQDIPATVRHTSVSAPDFGDLDTVIDLNSRFRSGYREYDPTDFDAECSDLTRILGAWRKAGRAFPLVRFGSKEVPSTNPLASGLVSLVDAPISILPRPREEIERHSYRNESGWDQLATKSVILMELGIQSGPNVRPLGIDWYYTHLDADERTAIKQAAELREFISNTHKPENVAILVGDFNVVTSGRNALYEQLSNIELRRSSSRRRISLRDAWRPEFGLGYTALLGDENVSRYEAAFLPDTNSAAFCAEPGAAPLPELRPARLDYCFIEEPHAEHVSDVDITRLRRVRFPRQAEAPDRDKIPFISDHLGLAFTLLVVPR